MDLTGNPDDTVLGGKDPKKAHLAGVVLSLLSGRVGQEGGAGRLAAVGLGCGLSLPRVGKASGHLAAELALGFAVGGAQICCLEAEGREAAGELGPGWAAGSLGWDPASQEAPFSKENKPRPFVLHWGSRA